MQGTHNTRHGQGDHLLAVTFHGACNICPNNLQGTDMDNVVQNSPKGHGLLHHAIYSHKLLTLGSFSTGNMPNAR